MANHLYCTWAHRTGLPSDLRARFRDLDEFVRALAASAKSRLLVVSPYLSPGGMASLRSAIAVSAQRGAWIRLVTSDLDNSHSANRRSVSVLLDGSDGVLIRPRLRLLAVSESLTELVHAKCMVVDGMRGYLGSANLSISGLEKNFELGVALGEEEAAALDHLISYFEANGDLEDRTSMIV